MNKQISNLSDRQVSGQIDISVLQIDSKTDTANCMVAPGYYSHRCCTDRYEPSAAAFSIAALSYHTNYLITRARQSDATQCYLHPKVFPWERHQIKLTCLFHPNHVILIMLHTQTGLQDYNLLWNLEYVLKTNMKRLCRKIISVYMYETLIM